MYLPASFREDRLPVLQEAIRQIGLGTLVTVGPSGPMASHLPFILDSEPAPYGTLLGHVARANQQWRETLPDMPALAIFLGPESYISPSWYATKRQTGRVVPTWNYVTVQASGPVRFIDDRERVRAIVARLTNIHEAAFSRPWSIGDAPADFIDAQLKAIVGVELRIERLEGKWKMSQNRPAEDRRGVMAGLTATGRQDAGAVASVMGTIEVMSDE